MVQINLLPWREQVRHEKKIKFAIALATSLTLSAFIVVMLHFYLAGLISDERESNLYLQNQITSQQTKLTTLDKKELVQKGIEDDIQFIVSMRQTSYQLVRFLNELPKIAPDTVSLLRIVKEGNNIIIEGKAQSNLDITAFIKNMSDSPIFNQPNLTEISSVKNDIRSEKSFQIQVIQKNR